MSKITDALHRAEQERRSMIAGSASALSGLLKEIKQELREVWIPDTAHNRLQIGQPPVRSAPPSAPDSALAAPKPLPSGQAQMVGAAKGLQPTESAAASRESWAHTIELVKRRLEVHEQETARQASEQVRLQAELDAAGQLLAKVTSDRAALQQHLEASRKAAASIEADKVSWLRQLESLRHGQRLSHTARMVEQELKANAAMLTQLLQSQQELANDVAHYRQRDERLQRQLHELRHSLAQALAVAGTTDPMGTTTVRSG